MLAHFFLERFPLKIWKKGLSCIQSRWLVLIAALYFTTVLNISLWRYLINHLELTSLKMVFFAATFPFVIFLFMVLFFNVVLVPYAAKPVLILLTLASSATNYLMFNLGILIDADMIRNALETNTREATDLMTFSAVIWVLLGGIVPSILISLARINYQPWLKELKTRLIIAVSCFAGIGLISAGFYKEYASFGRNNRHLLKMINTVNYLAAVFRHYRTAMMADQPFLVLDEEAKLIPYPDASKTVFILIVGETARADHFSLNGYGRNTNPELSKEDVVSFKKVFSCGTSTNVSVPCMFSNVTRKELSANGDLRNRENLLDLVHKTGYDVLWLENDDGCKGVCKRVPTENLYKSKNALYCDGESCFDEILTDGSEERLRKLKNNTVIVMHTIGSHGPAYFKRYPDTYKKFLPSCDTADLQNCSRDEIVNAYDNTIVYTDHVVASAIKTLKKFPQLESGLMYVSDHGESLGENGIYLHGMPYGIAPDGQKQVPMVLWMSERMKKQDHLNFSCIARKAEEQTFTHDYIFHTLLALLEVSSKTYDKSLDIFDSCREEPLPTNITLK